MNLAHIIDDHDAQHVALISRSRPTTYGALREQVAHLRGGLVELGVQRGDRVVLLCGNGRHFVIGYLATLGLGAVVVPLNPTSPAPEVQREIARIGARVAIVEPVAAAAWNAIAPATIPTVEHVVATESGSIPGAVDLAVLLSSPQADLVEVEPDTLAALMFTSGTAGAPRAAMLTHGNLLANLEQGGTAVSRIEPGDVVYGVLPLFHIFGLNVVLGLSLLRGATVVLVQRFDPSTALDTIRERKVTVLPGAPPLWLAFSHFDDAPADSFADVRLALTGAARMPEEAMRRLEERFGLEIREGYGLTEAAPVVTSSAGMPPRYGSVGKVLDGIEVRLVDESGDDVVLGDAGEIWVKGPNVFQGTGTIPTRPTRCSPPTDGCAPATSAPSTTTATCTSSTAKDLIIVSGFNVYPAEVEEVLAEHPGVAEVGVVGVPHPHHGEAVKAFVVPEPGALVDEDQLIDWACDRLARYKCPTKVLFVDELPRNVSGKLVRRSLV
ncbi:MAG: AMP-binding protein [Ilumatobacteraceae bacterium]